MQQTTKKGVQDKVYLGGKGDPLRIVQKIEISPYYRMVFGQTRMHPRQRDP